MRKLLKILAWFALLLVAVSLPLSFSSSYTKVSSGELGSGVGYAVTGLASAVALVLAVICGMATKSGYLWLGLTAAGLLYLASFYGYYVKPEFEVWKILVALLPGILLVAEGAVLRVVEQRRV